jgi:hypothetical protein
MIIDNLKALSRSDLARQTKATSAFLLASSYYAAHRSCSILWHSSALAVLMPRRLDVSVVARAEMGFVKPPLTNLRAGPPAVNAADSDIDARPQSPTNGGLPQCPMPTPRT